MFNYFVMVSNFPVKEQRKLRSNGREKVGVGKMGGLGGWGRKRQGVKKPLFSVISNFLFLLLPFLKGVLLNMLWMAFLNQENIRALTLTIAKIRFPPNSQNMFLFFFSSLTVSLVLLRKAEYTYALWPL